MIYRLVAAIAISITWTGCDLEECLHVDGDEISDEETMECVSSRFEVIATPDPEELRANLRRFAEKLRLMKMKEEEEKERMMNNAKSGIEPIIDTVVRGRDKTMDLTLDMNLLANHGEQDSPATTNESTDSGGDVTPGKGFMFTKLQRKISDVIPIVTPEMRRKRSATDSMVGVMDNRDGPRMAYSFVAGEPRGSSLIELAKSLSRQSTIEQGDSSPRSQSTSDWEGYEDEEEELINGTIEPNSGFADDMFDMDF